MRRWGFMAALAAAALAGQARAELSFSDFEKICVATAARPAAAVEAADRSGWLVTPDALLASTSKGGMLAQAGRVWSDADGFNYLYVSEPPREKDDPAGYVICMMAVGGPSADFVDKAKSWAAVPPEKGKKGSSTDYYFVVRDGNHQPMPADEAGANQAISSGGARMFSISSDRDGVSATLMAFTQ